MTHVSEFGFFTGIFSEQAGIAIRGGLVGLVATLLLMEIDLAITTRWGLFPGSIFGFEGLKRGTRFNQCAINREMIAGQ